MPWKGSKGTPYTYKNHLHSPSSTTISKIFFKNFPFMSSTVLALGTPTSPFNNSSTITGSNDESHLLVPQFQVTAATSFNLIEFLNSVACVGGNQSTNNSFAMTGCHPAQAPTCDGENSQPVFNESANTSILSDTNNNTNTSGSSNNNNTQQTNLPQQLSSSIEDFDSTNQNHHVTINDDPSTSPKIDMATTSQMLLRAKFEALPAELRTAANYEFLLMGASGGPFLDASTRISSTPPISGDPANFNSNNNDSINNNNHNHHSNHEIPSSPPSKIDECINNVVANLCARNFNVTENNVSYDTNNNNNNNNVTGSNNMRFFNSSHFPNTANGDDENGTNPYIESQMGNNSDSISQQFKPKKSSSSRRSNHSLTPCVCCDICGKRFKSILTLSVHIKTHKTSDRPHPCQYCGKGFMQQTHLKQHERCHTNEKPYVCNFCDKSFAQKSGVVQHERIHTGEKPYICKYCPKSYRQMSGLKQHLMKHKDTDPLRDDLTEIELAKLKSPSSSLSTTNHNNRSHKPPSARNKNQNANFDFTNNDINNNNLFGDYHTKIQGNFPVNLNVNSSDQISHNAIEQLKNHYGVNNNSSAALFNLTKKYNGNAGYSSSHAGNLNASSASNFQQSFLFPLNNNNNNNNNLNNVNNSNDALNAIQNNNNNFPNGPHFATTPNFNCAPHPLINLPNFANNSLNFNLHASSSHSSQNSSNDPSSTNISQFTQNQQLAFQRHQASNNDTSSSHHRHQNNNNNNVNDDNRNEINSLANNNNNNPNTASPSKHNNYPTPSNTLHPHHQQFLNSAAGSFALNPQNLQSSLQGLQNLQNFQSIQNLQNNLQGIPANYLLAATDFLPPGLFFTPQPTGNFNLPNALLFHHQQQQNAAAASNQMMASVNNNNNSFMGCNQNFNQSNGSNDQNNSGASSYHKTNGAGNKESS